VADELGLTVEACHFQPGTSKWNKVEHRMICHITNNWRGKPLLTRQIVVNLIGGVSTTNGLRIRAVREGRERVPVPLQNEYIGPACESGTYNGAGTNIGDNSETAAQVVAFKNNVQAWASGTGAGAGP
jgi:hypothetical protein